MKSKKPKIKTDMFGRPFIAYRSKGNKVANTSHDAEFWTITDVETNKFYNINATITYMLKAYPMD